LRRGPCPCAAPLRAAAPAGSPLGPSPRLFRSATCAPLTRLRGRSLRPRARGPALRGLRAPSRGSGRPCPAPCVSPAPSVPRRDPPGPPADAASGASGSGPGGYGGRCPPILAPAPGAFLSSGRSAALRGTASGRVPRSLWRSAVGELLPCAAPAFLFGTTPHAFARVGAVQPMGPQQVRPIPYSFDRARSNRPKIQEPLRDPTAGRT